jgi:CubicO group peptidase (beta-lactamase class C family)
MLDTVALSEKPNTGYQALLERSLRRIRKQYEVPALYAVVYYGGKIVGIGCDGVRKLGDPAPAQSTDKVLMASISKPIAATVLAALIDRGVLRWNTTLPEAFPGLASVILPEFQAVTLADLLCHRSGLSTDAVYRGKLPSANQPTQWRSAGVRNALTQPPQFPPKTRREYSNSGFIVAATMAESITGIPWESLAHHYLYDPAGMESVGFGRAISPFDVDQPIGHVRRDEKIVPENDNLMWVKAAPSGQVHCDMFDVVRFARIHIDGPAGRSSIASARTFREMHTPLFDAEQSLGFWFKKTERAYTLTHGGIVGGTGSWIQVEPANGLAIFVFHNYWSDRKIGNSTEGDAIRGSLTEALRADLGIR